MGDGSSQIILGRDSKNACLKSEKVWKSAGKLLQQNEKALRQSYYMRKKSKESRISYEAKD